MFYEFNQNNSGGSFDVDNKLCHDLYIEADSAEEANEIAESFGCYWDGVQKGFDCPCCGNRWSEAYRPMEIPNEWSVSQFMDNPDIEAFKKIYEGFEWIEEPKAEKKYYSINVYGKVKIESIEQYAQVMANMYSSTSPDIRIFYKNGLVTEIFKKTITKELNV